MVGCTVAVLTTHRPTRRQIARALHSGGISVQFVDNTGLIRSLLDSAAVHLLILDCDNVGADAIEETLTLLQTWKSPPPVVLLSIGENKGPLLKLIQTHDVGNLVAKHGAIRAVYPLLDERELLVTCEKVLQRNIFGIDKYVGGWGVLLHRKVVTSLPDKVPVLDAFERFLTDLDAPLAVIPSILTVAEELILNAVMHAPRGADGRAKYEDSVSPDLQLEPHEYVDIVYGCDGQRLMLSVADNFGGLKKETLYSYMQRGFSDPLEVESKPSGAGLGLAMAFRGIHQLIFNVHETRRTEVLAGWYLRINTSNEFRQVSKSLNLFWLPAASQPVEQPSEPSSGGELTRSGDSPT